MHHSLSLPLQNEPYYPNAARIPSSTLILHWGYLYSVNPQIGNIAALISNAQRTIAYQMGTRGFDAPLLISSNGTQRFVANIHNGLELIVENVRPLNLSWGNVGDIVRGVKVACVRDLCDFKVERGIGMASGGWVAKGVLSYHGGNWGLEELTERNLPRALESE